MILSLFLSLVLFGYGMWIFIFFLSHSFFFFFFFFFLPLVLSFFFVEYYLGSDVLYFILLVGCLILGRKLFHKKGKEQFLLLYFVCLGGPNTYRFCFIIFVDFGCYMCILVVFVGLEVVDSYWGGFLILGWEVGICWNVTLLWKVAKVITLAIEGKITTYVQIVFFVLFTHGLHNLLP